jgi:hypothetical protein
MLWFREQVVIEGVRPTVLLDEIDFIGTFNDINQFGNDRMIQLGKYVDFPLEVFKFIWFIKSFFLIDFDCYFLVCSFAYAHFDNPIRALTQLLVDLIEFELLLVLDLEINVHELLLGVDNLNLLFLLFLLLLLHLLDFQLVHVIGGELLLH